MMLRSSSTPILGSLLPESPSHHHFHLNAAAVPTIIHAAAFPSCNFSPASDHSDHSSSTVGVRRTRSAGSLHSLLSPDHPKPCSSSSAAAAARRCKPVLEPIPSFSMHSSKGLELEEVDEEEEEEYDDEPEEKYEDVACRGFAFGAGAHGKVHAAGGSAGSSLGAGRALPPLFLARGLGIDRVGSGFFTAGDGDDDGKCSVWTGNGGDKSGTEAYYKKMVEEDPSNALVLRNYAEFLYQSMGDLKRAEEYYSRAILADPGDGEIMSQYAKLVWELHGDEERATSYFQQAVQAAPNDSHVLAAYAGFLWETEDGEEDGQTHDLMAKPVHAGAFASAV